MKLGGDGGELQFSPDTITIAKGESVTWCAPGAHLARTWRARSAQRRTCSTGSAAARGGVAIRLICISQSAHAWAHSPPLCDVRVNNKGFPHNVVFDEDAIPAGVSAEALSHEDYLNAAGDSVTTKFDVAGSYSYYCEPHQGAGMAGKITVQ